jgi:recombination protein RecT
MLVDTSNTAKALQTQEEEKRISVKGLLEDPKYKKRFEEIMGKRSAAFCSSIISAVSMNKDLQLCDPNSVIRAGVMAATLDLPVDSNLGFAAIVPYNQKDGGKKAQFQIMAKGFVQLGVRSGQYKRMGVSKVYEGQLIEWDELTSTLKLDNAAKKSDKVIGYASYFQLINGFESYFYMSADEARAHGKQYSKSYAYDLRDNKKTSKWSQDFDVMALKTVKKLNLSRWGILSVDLQTAMKVDQAVIKSDNPDEAEFPDFGDGTIEANYTVENQETAPDGDSSKKA